MVRHFSCVPFLIVAERNRRSGIFLHVVFFCSNTNRLCSFFKRLKGCRDDIVRKVDSPNWWLPFGCCLPLRFPINIFWHFFNGIWFSSMTFYKIFYKINSLLWAIFIFRYGNADTPGKLCNTLARSECWAHDTAHDSDRAFYLHTAHGTRSTLSLSTLSSQKSNFDQLFASASSYAVHER